jgi:hypothetical protein
MFKWFRTSKTAATSQRKIVYDFLYCDTRRVASFLAQFNPAGYLTGQRRTSSSSHKLAGNLSVSLPTLGSSGGGDISREKGQASEETYDPFWVGAVSLLDHLEGRSLLKSDMHDAGIGQLVLVSGNLRFFDLRMIKEVFQVPKLAARFGIGDTTRITPEKAEENALVLELVKIMPHTVQAQVFCREQPDKAFSAAWMTLDPTSMVVPPQDILVKYGHWVAGDWKVLAIKDAPVDAGPQTDPELMQLFQTMDFGDAAAKRHSTPVAILAEFLAPIARKAMGRPGLFYGVTPIMIFREVRG